MATAMKLTLKKAMSKGESSSTCPSQCPAPSDSGPAQTSVLKQSKASATSLSPAEAYYRNYLKEKQSRALQERRQDRSTRSVGPSAPTSTPVAQVEYRVEVPADSPLLCLISFAMEEHCYQPVPNSGILGQAHCGQFDDEREVVIGLDFGTSSVKVVIGDLALGKAFAVPFCARDGVGRYLLPSRLYESAGSYSLLPGGIAHRDLKLSLMACPEDTRNLLRVAAFLALVIRHARSWLITSQRDIYCRTNILWKLVIGLPVAHHLDGAHRNVFRRAAHTAWLAACSDSGKVADLLLTEMKRRTEQLEEGAAPRTEAEEAEIGIVPEIAAQIYGFVASNRFDRNAPNRYMMVDVGAGTVDSSLFKVIPARGGKWDFSFFSSHVEQHGVMNLHRNRMRWWENALKGSSVSPHCQLPDLGNMKFATDQLLAIPDRMEDYFSGVSLKFANARNHPDEKFFNSNVLAQVRGRTMHRTYMDGILSQNDLRGIPVFLCGGGMRMKFYRRLESELRNMPGCTWLRAEARPLELPRSLSAPGLDRTDYDRMSVAFGLSFLEVGKIERSPPMPRSPVQTGQSWRDHYVDKDQC
jgi:hypothetical protein